MRSPHVRLRPAPRRRSWCLLVVGLCGSRSASAAPRRRGHRSRGLGHAGIVVVQVNGLIDPSNAALITKSLRDAAGASRVVARVPARRVRRGRHRHERRSSTRFTTRPCRSPCGSDRRAAVRVAPAPCSRWPRRTCRSRRARTSARSFRSTSTTRSAGRGRGATSKPSAALATTPIVSHRMSGKTAQAAKLIDGDRAHARPVHRRPRRHVLHTANGDVSMSTSKVVGSATTRRCRPTRS